MSYVRVQGVSLSGFRGIPVEIECAQSRRLPFIQILGAAPSLAGELRERVSAAIESAGLRLPGRKVTVRFQPAISGFSLENLDLAVALAILAASGRIPSARLENILVSGALALNGMIESRGSEPAVGKLLMGGKYSGAIVPWSESGFLRDQKREAGGGFRSLAEVIAYLTGQSAGICDDPGNSFAPPEFGRIGERELKILELIAAGAHHALLLSASSSDVARLARAVPAILPPLEKKELWEASALARLRPDLGLRPCIGISHLDRASAINEALFAKFGLLYLEKAAECENAMLNPLLKGMESGQLQLKQAGCTTREAFQATLIAGTPLCDCGGEPKCVCRPLERQRYRSRLESLLSGPFDIRQQLHPEAPTPTDWRAVQGRIMLASERMRKRSGKPNGRLSHDEVLREKSWSAAALRVFRSLSAEGSLPLKSQASVARLALTVSDLRDSSEIAEHDVLEARHYFGSF
jgi:magnesium chelatase family protein